MTTPQDIQAALDAFKMINRGPAESPNENEIMFNGFLLEKEVRIIEQILQSHAPEASPVDADSVLADFYRTSDLKGVTIGEDTVLRVFYRYLLRRGFRQGGGKGDVLIATLQDIKGMTDADDPESYRCDDREGCLDTVFEVASEALARCVPDDGGGND